MKSGMKPNKGNDVITQKHLRLLYRECRIQTGFLCMDVLSWCVFNVWNVMSLVFFLITNNKSNRCITYQNRIRKVFAINNVRQTSSEKPSASCVTRIWRYCGMYGMAPPKIIAVAAAAFTKWLTRRSNSSIIIQSILRPDSITHNLSQYQ